MVQCFVQMWPFKNNVKKKRKENNLASAVKVNDLIF